MEQALQDAQAALLEARLDDADAQVALAAESLSCGSVVSRRQISRFWLIRGAVEHFAGRKERAAEAFIAAYRAEPTVHIDDFGPAFDQALEVAVLEAPRSFARLQTDPAEPDAELMLNGHRVKVPLEVGSGAYTLQFLARNGDVLQGQLLRLEPGIVTTVETSIPARASVAELTPRARKPVPGLLVVAAAAGALAAGSGAMYLRENGVMRTAPDTQQLAAARDRQVGFGAAGISLAGVAVTSVGVHLAISL